MLSLLPKDILTELLKYNTFYALFLIDKNINSYLTLLKNHYIKYHDDDIISVKYDDLYYQLKYKNKFYKVDIGNAFYFKLSTYESLLYICVSDYIKYYIYKDYIYNLTFYDINVNQLELIDLVKDQTNCSEKEALFSLIQCHFDVVLAIMYITE
jgi:hypothetical protein